MDILNINKELHGKGYISFNPSQKYFTLQDILKLQEFLNETFTNFNGGFGMFNFDEHIISEKVGDIIFSFSVPFEIRSDQARRVYRTKQDPEFMATMPFVFNYRNCIEQLTWLETIIFLCENLNIPFQYDPSIIDIIIEKFNNLQNAKE